MYFRYETLYRTESRERRTVAIECSKNRIRNQLAQQTRVGAGNVNLRNYSALFLAKLALWRLVYEATCGRVLATDRHCLFKGFAARRAALVRKFLSL